MVIPVGAQQAMALHHFQYPNQQLKTLEKIRARIVILSPQINNQYGCGFSIDWIVVNKVIQIGRRTYQKLNSWQVLLL